MSFSRFASLLSLGLLCFLLSGTILSASANAPAAAAPATTPAARAFEVRQVLITDETANTVHEIHVAAGTPTTLVFQTPLAEGDDAVVFAAPRDVVPDPLKNTRTLLIGAERDLRPGESYPITLRFADGQVQTFQLVTVPGKVDVKVDVTLALEKRASPESPAALKASIGQLQSRLDECQSTSATVGVSKIASLILKQDQQKPQAFTVERIPMRHLDKQSRLLVEVRAAYRLFAETYVVLTVQNRDPSKVWVMDRPEVGVEGGGEAASAKIISFSTELPQLPPDEEQKLVIVFSTPPQAAGQTFTLSLLEKAGSRHVKLEGVRL